MIFLRRHPSVGVEGVVRAEKVAVIVVRIGNALVKIAELYPFARVVLAVDGGKNLDLARTEEGSADRFTRHIDNHFRIGASADVLVFDERRNVGFLSADIERE